MYDPKNKDDNLKSLNLEMLNKTLSMFEYENLPDSIPSKELERILQTEGFCLIAEHSGDLYAFSGTLGGEQDAYGNLTEFMVNNTYLKLNKSFNLKKDKCVLFQNDDLKIGLIPTFTRLNSSIVENDINIQMWGYNSRQQKMISASDDKTKASAENYLSKIVDGELSVIGDSAFLENLKSHGVNSSGSIKVKEFIELTQYLKSNLYNAVGLSSQFNMKKERLISSEVDMGEDSIFPLVYTMMKNRISAIENMNEIFGLSIEVDFGSVWALKNKKLVDDIIEDGLEDEKTNELENGKLADVSVQSGELPIQESEEEESTKGKREIIVDDEIVDDEIVDDEIVDDEIVDDEIVDDNKNGGDK